MGAEVRAARGHGPSGSLAGVAAGARKVALAAAAALVAGAAAPAWAWTQTYVVDWYEPAHYFGAREGATSPEAPGTDCPKGANPENDWVQLLTTPYRTREEALALLDPANRGKLGDRNGIYAKRGPNREDVLAHPESVPDPGMLEVEGDIAYGFNLDGDEKTGFTSPTGEKGVDNAYYRATGCVSYYRGPSRDAAGFKYTNDGMRDGSFTMLIVLSGEQDPRNDPHAKLGIYASRDKMVKDANSAIAADYSFRIDPNPKYQSVFDVRITDGVIETTGPVRIAMRDYKYPEPPLLLQQGRVRFEMKPDGSLVGMVGGYRDWRDHHRGSARVVVELVGRINTHAWWYALRRRADGLPDPKTGENRGISTAYQLWAIPSFAIAPDTAAPVTEAKDFLPAMAAQTSASQTQAQ
jgi:hypothetical protein